MNSIRDFSFANSKQLFNLDDFSKPNFLNSGIWHDVGDGFEYYIDMDKVEKHDMSLTFNKITRSLIATGLIEPEIYQNKMIKKMILLPSRASNSITATIENNRLKICVPKEQDEDIVIPIL